MASRNASQRAEQRRLREQMQKLGMSRAETAAEMSRRYKLRPRAAWRAAWGWTLDEAAGRYNALPPAPGREPATSLTGSRLSEWENWPFSARRPSVTGLCLLARVYQCGTADLVDVHDREKFPAAELTALGAATFPAVRPGLAPFPPGVPGSAAFAVPGNLVAAVADESGEYASRSAGMLVPAERLGEIREDVRQLARAYHRTPPLAFIAEACQIRVQACRMAERTRRPGQITGLYEVAGQACALMSVASFDLAVWSAAIEQAHAARTFAEIAGHPALQAWTLGMLGLIAYWHSRPRDAVRWTAEGLELAVAASARARLHSISARAWAHLGDSTRTREAIAAADRERDAAAGQEADDLHDGIGGEFGWGPARQERCAASALLRIGDPGRAAARAAEAIRLHPGDPTGSLVDMTARADLAAAELVRGRLDAAEDALDNVWTLPAQHRRYGLVGRLEDVVAALAAPRYAKAPRAAALAERIKAFTRESAPQVLPAGGSALLPRG